MTLTIVVCAMTMTVACPARAASARDPKFQPNLEATVRYLQNVQQENGGFAEPGSEPGSDFTAWVTLALAAAGINPRDQTTARQHYQDGHSAYAYLAEHAHEASLTTDFERELLVVDAAGASPYDFGAVDLVGEILGRQIATGDNAGAFVHEAGSWEPGINDTIFAILALSPIQEPTVEAAIARATRWLEAQQKCDGSWTWEYTPRVGLCSPHERHLLPKEAPGEVDMTGAALQALSIAKHPNLEGQERAFAYLREAETFDGGFPEFLDESEPHGGEPNVASTAWVVQAMWSAGINPEEESWRTGQPGLESDEPLGYLASMQQPDGHIRYEADQELNGMWMTAYVTPAFTGNALPIPAVPYEELPLQPPQEPTTGGDDGVSTSPGSGVIAGGGGNGARLFSRPQPGSRGDTPGGDRQLGTGKHDPPPPRKRNPGPVRRKIALTIKSAAMVSTSSTNRQSRSSGDAKRDSGPGARPAGTGASSGGTGEGGAPFLGAAARSTRATAGAEVTGVLIGDPKSAYRNDRLEAGAPGLHSASAGGDREQWPATVAYVTIALLVLAGALIERRRPQATV